MAETNQSKNVVIMETYEKKYKDAQKWIESIYTELSHKRQMEAEAFFPELKESVYARITSTTERKILSVHTKKA